MPNELYTKIVDENGEESYTLTESIPDEVIYEDPRYKTIQERDIKRRNRFNNLVETMATDGYVFERDANGGILSDDEGNILMSKETVQEVTPPVVAVPTIDEIYGEITKRQREEREAELQAKQARETLINSAMEKHGLKGDVARSILEQSNDVETIASTLGREKLFFGETNSGQTDEEARKTEVESIGERLQKRMGKPD